NSSLPKMRVFCFYTTTNPAVSRVFASYQGAKLEKCKNALQSQDKVMNDGYLREDVAEWLNS
ncbi:hypothetical protein, partial [Alicyclobacillus suci]|uniref:hypothetical protein n=1 Tax=Alicyclobacillus suci TaxID=2816080 RepID=UPI001A8C2160